MSRPEDPPAPRLSKGERTRTRILDSATELFSKSGFYAVSLRDIAAHAGLTHAGLLHHFPGKETLLIEVLSRRDRDDAEVLFDSDPADEPEQLLTHIVGIVERNMRTPGLVGLYVKISGEAADPDHPAHQYFVNRYRVLRGRLATALDSLAARQDPPLDYDPAQVASQLLALMDGLQTQWLLEPEAAGMRAAVVDFLARLGLDLRSAPLFPVGAGLWGPESPTQAAADSRPDRPADPAGSARRAAAGTVDTPPGEHPHP
ncbi:TetR/AcrR family transcriptional regulator [Streptomyces sp. RB6PN25]|uniref:TetR/AcrR family transcriptional regulator n=1 Tax=Streptomyces humicola TaxID=2953240 RepID=A0ABT1PPW5_9ACTN|nr:TetR/AcrR family transcriptional regulator [Streptomyces humicola]MCQ4079728.1 TetR/AcrR family transcriptional regulator [Streptomyces humicola]